MRTRLGLPRELVKEIFQAMYVHVRVVRTTDGRVLFDGIASLA